MPIPAKKAVGRLRFERSQMLCHQEEVRLDRYPHQKYGERMIQQCSDRFGRGVMLKRIIGCICIVFGSTAVGAENFFTDSVAPLLAQRCLGCHNDHDAKGGLSLSTPQGLNELAFVDTADADASHLLDVVTPQGGQAQMPKDAQPLSADEIQRLRTWIAAGARWPDGYVLEPSSLSDRSWWSLQPLASPLLHRAGDTADSSAAKTAQGPLFDDNPVDRFIDAMLAEQGLTAVPQADPRTLIRRLTFDLTGLPPTIEEVDSFLHAAEQDLPQAWQAAVDRLLGSPGFGEKWGQHWLDLARYAETHGYDKDKMRDRAWPYRDYVIRSFNEDKPYGRFVREQVAGDVLFPNEPDGVLGLGFLAAGPWDFIGHWEVGEGKLDGRIAKHLDRDEMVSAVFNVFLSTTIQCAQCHHHKFDPVRMEDYYRLHAVFAAVDRADRVYDGLSIDQQRQRDDLAAKLGRLKAEQQTLQSEIKSKVDQQAAGIDRRIAELMKEFAPETGPQPQYGYHSQITANADEPKWVQVDLGRPQIIEEVRLRPAYDRFNDIGAGFGFPLRYKVEVADDGDFTADARVLKDASDADQTNPHTQPIVIRGDGRPFRYLRVTAIKLRERMNDYIFALGEIEALTDQGKRNAALRATVTAKDSIEAGVRWGTANLIDGVYFRELTDSMALRELSKLRAERKEIENSVTIAGSAQRLSEIQAKLEKWEPRLRSFPAGQMVYAAATHFPRGGRFTPTEGQPRTIHLLRRGDQRSPAERMEPGAPPLWDGAQAVFFAATPQHDNTTDPGAADGLWNEGHARAELARYLTARDNPLIWRSIVNRLWLWTFGSPLVDTPNDFGRGGMQPTHPELLDYLAVRLRDDPQQSLRSIVRLLVNSRAYRRASRTDSVMASIDRDNRYFWRANRRRLSAEEFRDSLLAVAGILDRRPGGPSFQDFVVDKPQHSPHYEYHLHDPADPASHRRSVYRLVVRSQPQPLLTTLDCADPSISIPQRDESTTVLQALAGWNNRFVEFASRQFGVQLEELPQTASERVDTACRLVLGRDPSPLERTVLQQHLRQHGTASLARVLFNLNAFLYLD